MQYSKFYFKDLIPNTIYKTSRGRIFCFNGSEYIAPFIKGSIVEGSSFTYPTQKEKELFLKLTGKQIPNIKTFNY